MLRLRRREKLGYFPERCDREFCKYFRTTDSADYYVSCNRNSIRIRDNPENDGLIILNLLLNGKFDKTYNPYQKSCISQTIRKYKINEPRELKLSESEGITLSPQLAFIFDVKNDDEAIFIPTEEGGYVSQPVKVKIKEELPYDKVELNKSIASSVYGDKIEPESKKRFVLAKKAREPVVEPSPDAVKATGARIQKETQIDQYSSSARPSI